MGVPCKLPVDRSSSSYDISTTVVIPGFQLQRSLVFSQWRRFHPLRSFTPFWTSIWRLILHCGSCPASLVTLKHFCQKSVSTTACTVEWLGSVLFLSLDSEKEFSSRTCFSPSVEGNGSEMQTFTRMIHVVSKYSHKIKNSQSFDINIILDF